MYSSSPSYLTRQGDRYYFRMSIPKDLRKAFGKTEIRRTLGTGQRKEARLKASLLALQVHDIIDIIEKNMNTNLTPEHINQMLHQRLLDALDQWENTRTSRGTLALSFLEDNDKCLSGAHAMITKALTTNNHQFIAQTVDEMLDKNGISIDKDSLDYKKLCRETLKSVQKELVIEKRRNSGDYSDDEELYTAQGHTSHVSGQAKYIPQSTTVAPMYPSPVPLTTLSAAIEKYIKYKVDSGNWGKVSQKDVPPMLNDFLSVVGDMPTSSLNRDKMMEYYTALLKAPKNRQMKKYRHKTLAELAKMNAPEDQRLSTRTIENRFDQIMFFLNWCEEENFISKASHLKSVLKLPKHMKSTKLSTRAPFTDEDLNKLFHSDRYIKNTHTGAAKHWAPLIALFTGARLEEVCQLQLSDIRQEDGVWVFDINDEGDKSVKTLSSKRLIPIHPTLIEVGLLDRVKALETKRQKALFPKLNRIKSNGKLGNAVSKSFCNLRDAVGIPARSPKTGDAKNFHSFRHTFASRCQEQRLPRDLYKRILGHETHAGSDVTNVYEHATLVNDMYNDVITKIDFSHVLDFDALKRTKWIHNP